MNKRPSVTEKRCSIQPTFQDTESNIMPNPSQEGVRVIPELASLVPGHPQKLEEARVLETNCVLV